MSDPTLPPFDTAVVLGGGGVTGIAWEIGLLAGLLDEGIDLADADIIIGTSAGAFAATFLADHQVEEGFQRQFIPSIEDSIAMAPEVRNRYQAMIAAGNGDREQVGRNLGRLALETPTVSRDRRAEIVASRLATIEWPAGPLVVTAVDAETGALRLLERNDGVDFLTAISATGAVPGLWPAVELLGRQWIDGGVTSSANPRLASSSRRAVVIAPSTNTFEGPDGFHLEVARLRTNTEVESVVPDDASREAIGPNVFDAARRGVSAIEGRRQGRLASKDVRRLLLI